jgi:hypothetical protein
MQTFLGGVALHELGFDTSKLTGEKNTQMQQQSQ